MRNLRNLKKLTSVLVAGLLLATTLVSCSSDQGKSSSTAEESSQQSSSSEKESEPEQVKTKDPVMLEFLAPQNGPINDWDLVLAEFESRTKDTLNTKINFTVTGFDDIGQKVSLKLTSGQNIDSVFTAQWTNPSVNNMALKGQVLNLDQYFNNDTYPGLKTAFDETYINQNKFVGKDGAMSVYAIPFAHEYGGTGTYIYYRLDLAQKYGLGELQNWEDLNAYFAKIQENEKGMTPYVSLGSTDGMQGIAGQAEFSPVVTKHNYKDIRGMGVVVKDDGTAYVSRNVIPFLDPEYAKLLPENSYNKEDPLYAYKAVRRWYEDGIIQKDILNVKDHQGLFCNGKAAAFNRGVDTYTGIKTQLEGGVKGAKLGFVNIDPNKDVKNNYGADFQAWNFAAIPATSKNADRVMEFYDWIFTSQENLDLFELGLENKHWVADGDTGFKPQTNPDTGKDWNFGAFVMTWSPTIRRYDSASPDFINDELKKGADAQYFFKNITAGFTFNPEPVKAIDAQVVEIKSGLLAIENGTVADIEGEIKKINDRLAKADYEKWCQEYEKQFNEFLKSYPYEGQ